MELSELTARLDEELELSAYADVDASPNGLQVGPETGSIEHVAVAVDAAVETVTAAREAGADLLFTHHGVVFGSIERVTGTHYRRIEALLEGDLPLYVAHLPLDGHQVLGNAAGIADLLELTDREPFGTMGPVHVGQRGRATDPFAPAELGEVLADVLDTGGREVQVLEFGPERVEDVAIVTGSGVDWLGEAAEVGVDVLITGEGKQHAYHEARELEMNVVLAGHYATETFCVQRVASLLEEWGLETTFVDCPTGI